MPRVVLAMSGGVDSSVAAYLLIQHGYDVVGVFMRHGEQSPVTGDCSTDRHPEAQVRTQLPIVRRLDHKQGCCTAADAEDARRVADKLDIPFYVLNLQEEFGRIIDYFVGEYIAGRTPNPCVQCNNWIKFGKLFDYADGIGADYVATGHYARLERNGDDVALLRGVDADKDQSYVLFGIKPKYVPRMMLPIGTYQKSTIRKIAAHLGLRVAEKPDSQEICFVTQDRYDEFVRYKRGEADQTGELVTTDGTVVGHHAGVERFTVGQRKGLGVALGAPKYVVRIEQGSRRVVIGDREELMRRELTAGQLNWLVPDRPTQNLRQRGHVQIRYNADAAPAVIELLPDGQLHVLFDEPQFGVAPGQAVVCYDSESNRRVLGGGWIE